MASRPSATVRRRIEFADTDASGRYHYATAMRLFEAAESELLGNLGLLEEIYTSMPRARVAFDYLEVLEFMDDVEATVSVAELGRTSITYSFLVSKAGRRCVAGTLVAVFVTGSGEPQPWEERHRQLLNPG